MSQVDARPSETRIKHLEMIQAVITRMANNSFLIKGWCVTLVSALLALSAKDSNHTLVFIAFFPLLMMWILDAFFLRQERLFRNLYDECRVSFDRPSDFSMNTSRFNREVHSWLKVMFSKTLLLFYGAMAVAVFLAVAILRGWHHSIKIYWS
jgi:hypothetical protein